MKKHKLYFFIFALSLLGSQHLLATKPPLDKRTKVIKIGNTGPYSGSFVSYSRVLKTIRAYFKMVNDQGGINGRWVEFISRDDSYDPKKTLEEIQKLVEEDHVLLTLFTIGTPSNIAIRDYMNQNKVPQLFSGSGAYLLNMPDVYPWTNPGVPDYIGEAATYAKYLLQNHPDAKIAVLYQDDDYGRLYFYSFLKTLGEKAGEMIVAYVPYKSSDKDLKPHIQALKNSCADTFLNISTPRFTILSIEEMIRLDWKPMHFLTFPAASREHVLEKVGFENVQGVLTAQITKDPANPKWDSDSDMVAYKEFMKKYVPDLDPNDVFIVAGYYAASLAERVLWKCGDELTGDKIISVRNQLATTAPLMLPGISIALSEDDLRLVKAMQIVKFEGSYWMPVGQPLHIE